MKSYEETAKELLKRRDEHVKRRKQVRKRAVVGAASTFCCLTVIIGAVLTMSRGNYSSNANQDVSVGVVTESSTASDTNNGHTSTQYSNDTSPVKYSSILFPDSSMLIPYPENHDLTSIFGSGEWVNSGCADIASIDPDDDYIKDSSIIVEGTVTSHEKRMTGPEGYVCYFSDVYDFLIERVWYGDDSLKGQSITIEDEFLTYVCSEDFYNCLENDRRYVLALKDVGDISNNGCERKGRYETLLRFVPEIEATLDGRYIVYSTMKTLTEAGCRDIENDLNLNIYNDYIWRRLRLVDSDVFETQMNKMIDMYLNKNEAS